MENQAIKYLMVVCSNIFPELISSGSVSNGLVMPYWHVHCLLLPSHFSHYATLHRALINITGDFFLLIKNITLYKEDDEGGPLISKTFFLGNILLHLVYFRWYQEKFDNYPKDRKAFIPFVI